MSEFTLTKRIAARPEDVFAVAADFRRAPERIRGIEAVEVLGDAPIGVGARFRETRVVFGKRATEEMEVVGFDPPRSYALRCVSHGCEFHTGFRFEPDGAGGTVVRVRFESRPRSFGARLLGVLFAFMAKACRNELQKDLDDLEAAVAGGRSATGAVAGPPKPVS